MNSTPVPLPLHAENAEKEARQIRAVNLVMLRDKMTHPEAEKKVAAEGVENVLKGLDTPILSDSAVMAALKKKLANSPLAVIDFLMEVEARLGKLEGLKPDTELAFGENRPVTVSTVPATWGQ